MRHNKMSLWMRARARIGALVRDEGGGILSAEMVLVMTVLGAGVLVGLNAVQNAVVTELGDVASAVSGVDQSYSYGGKVLYAGVGNGGGVGCGRGAGLGGFNGRGNGVICAWHRGSMWLDARETQNVGVCTQDSCGQSGGNFAHAGCGVGAQMYSAPMYSGCTGMPGCGCGSPIHQTQPETLAPPPVNGNGSNNGGNGSVLAPPRESTGTSGARTQRGSDRAI